MDETGCASQDLKAKENDRVSLKFVNQKGEEMFFAVQRKSKMSKVFASYCQRHGLQIGSVRFFYDGGKRIPPEMTPFHLGLESGDQIEVLSEVHGGGLRSYHM